MRRRKFTAKFQSARELADRFKISAQQISTWKREFLEPNSAWMVKAERQTMPISSDSGAVLNMNIFTSIPPMLSWTFTMALMDMKYCIGNLRQRKLNNRTPKDVYNLAA